MSAFLLLRCLAASVSASSIWCPSVFRRSLLTNPPAPAPTFSDISSTPNRATDSPATLSGLQDAASTGTTTVTFGHFIDDTGLRASNTYSTGPGGVKASSPGTTGTWGQVFTYSAINANGDTRTDIYESSTGITIESVKFNQKNIVWMLDAASIAVYKINTDSSGSGTGAVIGVFKTSPSKSITSFILLQHLHRAIEFMLCKCSSSCKELINCLIKLHMQALRTSQPSSQLTQLAQHGCGLNTHKIAPI